MFSANVKKEMLETLILNSLNHRIIAMKRDDVGHLHLIALSGTSSVNSKGDIIPDTNSFYFDVFQDDIFKEIAIGQSVPIETLKKNRSWSFRG